MLRCINCLVKEIEKLHVYRDTLLDLKSKARSDTKSCANLKKNEFFASLLGVTEPEEILIHAPTNVRNKVVTAQTQGSNHWSSCQGLKLQRF